MTEQETRDLLRSMVRLGENIAAVTPTAIDDTIVDGALTIVSTDAYWAIAWRIIEGAMGYFDSENARLIVEANGDTGALSDETEMDPATVMVIIQLALEIIKWWRNR